MNVTRQSLLSTSRVLAAFALTAVAVACGGSEDPTFAKPVTNDPANPAPTGSPDSGAGTTNPPPAGTDAGSTTTPTGGTVGIGCGTSPTRYVVLGHSVAHCFQAGGVDAETCSLKSTHTLLAKRFPGLTYENYAVDGAVISGVVKTQLPKVAGGAGHVFVNLYIGGNDLAAHLYEPEATAIQSWEKLKPGAVTDYEAIFTFFNDKSKFPDGATILVNSQYNPFDECVAGQFTFATLGKQNILTQFNAVLATIVAGHPNSILVDQYTTFLGHGQNYNQAKCPKYVSGYEAWMADLIHPNVTGHVNLAKQMSAGVDAIYTCK